MSTKIVLLDVLQESAYNIFYFLVLCTKTQSGVPMASWGIVSVYSEITDCYSPHLSNIHFEQS